MEEQLSSNFLTENCQLLTSVMDGLRLSGSLIIVNYNSSSNTSYVKLNAGNYMQLTDAIKLISVSLTREQLSFLLIAFPALKF